MWGEFIADTVENGDTPSPDAKDGKGKERREWETSLDTIKEYTEEENERRRKWEEQRQYF